MTTTTHTTTDTGALAGPPTDQTTTRPSRALAARRAFLVASPVLAGVFAVIGAYADPGAGISGPRMLEIYAANPEPLQFKSLGFHWAYAFWIAPALLAVPYVRGRGAWLATLAGLDRLRRPGHHAGPAAHRLVRLRHRSAVRRRRRGRRPGPHDRDHVGPRAVHRAGHARALPGPAADHHRAVARAPVRWWAFVAVLGGYAAFMLSGVLWWGCAITTVCFTVFAVALEKGTRPQD